MWAEAAALAAQAYMSYRSSKAQSTGQQQTNALSINEAAKQRAWAENFYKHRHQWEVEDLRKAGLNPVLSAKFGGGQVPTGATPSNLQNPQGHRSHEGLQFATAAKTIALLGEELKALKKDNKLRDREIWVKDKTKYADVGKAYMSPIISGLTGALGVMGAKKIIGAMTGKAGLSHVYPKNPKWVQGKYPSYGD